MLPIKKEPKPPVKRSLLESLMDADPGIAKQEPPQKRPRSHSATAPSKHQEILTLDIVSSSSSSSDSDEDTKQATMDRVAEQLRRSPFVTPTRGIKEKEAAPRLEPRAKHQARAPYAITQYRSEQLAISKKKLKPLIERAVDNLALLRHIEAHIDQTNRRGTLLGLQPADGLRLLKSVRDMVVNDARMLKAATHRLAKTYRNRYSLSSAIYSSSDEEASDSDA
jgi:hypothetical protein